MFDKKKKKKCNRKIAFSRQYAGLQLREVKNLPDGTLDMTELQEKLRPTDPYDFESYTSLVCVENTQNYLGGVVLPLEWLDQVIYNKINVISHSTGSRWFILSPFSGL